jgi:sulfide dehydrogenase cytochrome subunit
MQNIMKWIIPAVIGVAAAATVHAAEPEQIPVEIIAGSCAACHGTDGKSPGAMPTIAGKPYDTLIEALRGFKSGALPSTVMGRHAKGYTDGELEALARHFSSQN